MKHDTVLSQERYQAINPMSGAVLPGTFRLSSNREIDSILVDSVRSFDIVRAMPSTRRADLLDEIARQLGARKAQIVERAALETGLPGEARLSGELDRTCAVLGIFASAVRSGAVQDVRITTADPSRSPRPRPDVRRMRVGIGPVAVIEASNFPLAFGVMGGDAGSAMAAGCPVIAKVHPFHPGTSHLIAEGVQAAIQQQGFPAGFFSLVHGGPSEVLSLVQHPFVRGVGFTGSRSAGIAIREAANSRARPLDELSLEMGSLNPVFFFPAALARRGAALAKGLVESVLVGGGQFCTKPGNFFVPLGPEGDHFIEEVSQAFSQAGCATLLSPHLSTRYRLGCDALRALPQVSVLAMGQEQSDVAASAQPMLLIAEADAFFQEPSLREEVFGPVSIVVRGRVESLIEMARAYEGELTGTVHADQEDRAVAARVVLELSGKVGRLLFDGFPPGVELCDGVNHGGPWPAALGRSTVVGTTSYERWLRPFCVQDMPPEMLPPELDLANSLGLARRMDGLAR